MAGCQNRQETNKAVANLQ